MPAGPLPDYILPGPLAIRANTSHAFEGILLFLRSMVYGACMLRVRLRLVARPTGSARELPIGSK